MHTKQGRRTCCMLKCMLWEHLHLTLHAGGVLVSLKRNLLLPNHFTGVPLNFAHVPSVQPDRLQRCAPQPSLRLLPGNLLTACLIGIYRDVWLFLFTRDTLKKSWSHGIDTNIKQLYQIMTKVNGIPYRSASMCVVF